MSYQPLKDSTTSSVDRPVLPVLVDMYACLFFNMKKNHFSVIYNNTLYQLLFH